ncbi:hypothetical protein THF1D04_280047 [Vibrio owensii]|uniref:Uncharacterized protein n=1 Tax=Vibrio owensii TaxID=696485 RepID=A0AAU9Q847_9VIBR|nr:hypothetical protein THF1D04_280047 [Vibrio owensii]
MLITRQFWPSEPTLSEKSEYDDALCDLLTVKAIKKRILTSQVLNSRRQCVDAQTELNTLSMKFERNCIARATLEQEILAGVTGQRKGVDDITLANCKIVELKTQNVTEQMTIQEKESELEVLLSEKRRLEHVLNSLERQEEKIQTLLGREA